MLKSELTVLLNALLISGTANAELMAVIKDDLVKHNITAEVLTVNYNLLKIYDELKKIVNALPDVH